MAEEDMTALADYVISFFGFDSEVIDNRLDMGDRDVFYTLPREEGGVFAYDDLPREAWLRANEKSGGSST